MRKKKFVNILVVGLMLLFLVSTIPSVYAGKPIYWLVTDGDNFIDSVFVEHVGNWTEDGPNEQIAQFEWFVDKGTSRGGPSLGSDKPIGGTKAILSMTSSGDDLQLNIQIYKGGAKNPSADFEIYQWYIIDGKNSDYDCITVVFNNTITGATISMVSLYENDVVTIGIPHILMFECRMWLI